MDHAETVVFFDTRGLGDMMPNNKECAQPLAITIMDDVFGDTF